ncbi:MAG: hypothetical protein CL933_05825 [Deltaproteobacteria bacterium]|nr:hypothetical protein [Deltaproteobacteria bacterium]
MSFRLTEELCLFGNIDRFFNRAASLSGRIHHAGRLERIIRNRTPQEAEQYTDRGSGHDVIL